MQRQKFASLKVQGGEPEAGTDSIWRRGWDSNPRYGFPHARFRGEYFQPLSHLSAVVGFILSNASQFRLSSKDHRYVMDYSANNSLTPCGEERLQQRGGLLGKYTGCHFHLVIQFGAGQ